MKVNEPERTKRAKAVQDLFKIVTDKGWTDKEMGDKLGGIGAATVNSWFNQGHVPGGSRWDALQSYLRNGRAIPARKNGPSTRVSGKLKGKPWPDKVESLIMEAVFLGNLEVHVTEDEITIRRM